MIRIMILIFPISFPMYFSCISNGFPQFFTSTTTRGPPGLRPSALELSNLQRPGGEQQRQQDAQCRGHLAATFQRGLRRFRGEWGTVAGVPHGIPGYHPSIYRWKRNPSINPFIDGFSMMDFQMDFPSIYYPAIGVITCNYPMAMEAHLRGFQLETIHWVPPLITIHRN